MPSTQERAQRLQEQAYRTLLPQIRDLEQDLRSISSSISTQFSQIERKLETLRNIELPTTEVILTEIIEDISRQKEIEAGSLAFFARALRQKETQEEILTELLNSAQKYFPRVALFTVRGNQFLGWSSRGYSDEKAREVSSCNFSRSECVRFQEALEAEGTITELEFSDQNGPLQVLQEDSQKPLYLFPMKAMQRPVALLLVAGADGIVSRKDALTILVELTVLRIENIAYKILQQLIPAPPQAAPKPVYQAVIQPVTLVVPEPIPPPPPQPVYQAEPEPIPQPTPQPVYQFEPEPTPPPPLQPAVQAVPETLAKPVPETALPQVEEPAEKIELPPEPVLHPEPEPIPIEPAPAVFPAAIEPEKPRIEKELVEEAKTPPPIEIPVAAAPPIVKPERPKELHLVGEEDKLHSDAKRFARLLVSEIKLYNERHVVEGRQNHDLYLRLKKDIDRSREMYEKRVSPAVSRKMDYFHDEIIRILGDNDPSTLGSDYPGPRVES